ncbi:YciK family oxidoreductase [Psychrosphaera sp. B3R10]|uniref:YciK family oxidoreductase n=1 Tax=unclassified Psychrosphaera TaxID=2641570 RepID=UPI001C091AE8|nr:MULTISPECIES: YciK family oxidoreductase [unclassified Psychrosphaera]MBU2882384.1 YciK family oxidoreductase [Psychrosphaera sp. I2R16]MBU2989065.1 YciK family oxidoreductase [Psychrosphaera sp. B3R10]MDO6718061.1 YciK family oxidoreductase [Psychrosphaera sp. 1_MG-2023]
MNHVSFKPAANELDGKVILITGAGDGIGRQAALTYAKLGAETILLGKTVKKLTAVYDQIVAEGGKEPAIIPLDMKGATVKNYKDMALTIESEFGKLDGLLNNASILNSLNPIDHIYEDAFDKVMKVNLKATLFLTQALIPVLKKADKSSVIFTSSGVGKKGRAFWGEYAISKFATEGLMQTMADEFGHTNIRTNCINPGATKTTMRSKAYPSEDVSLLKLPEDIMPTYVYLMSDQSVDVNGESLDAQPK